MIEQRSRPAFRGQKASKGLIYGVIVEVKSVAKARRENGRFSDLPEFDNLLPLLSGRVPVVAAETTLSSLGRPG
jgi:hypothetical protein